jgi:hypothetical protein
VAKIWIVRGNGPIAKPGIVLIDHYFTSEAEAIAAAGDLPIEEFNANADDLTHGGDIASDNAWNDLVRRGKISAEILNDLATFHVDPAEIERRFFSENLEA